LKSIKPIIGDSLNFSTQYFPALNTLKNWVSNDFYPYFMKLKEMKNTFRVYSLILHEDAVAVERNGTQFLGLEELISELSFFDKKAGVYGVHISKNGSSAIIYIGKSKKLSNRVRQHLTGKNIDGSPLASTTAHKYEKIIELLRGGECNVKFFIWTNKKLTDIATIDYALGVFEVLLISASKTDFKKINIQLENKLKHWNLRIG